MDETVKETQSAFKNIIDKPKLTGKLLKKPPFRFVQDIVTATSKATGFADGLF